MVKVLGQAGTSLADVYDVEGSIAGVEQLDSEEVHLVHEMGATIFSERASGSIRRMVTGAILENTTWDITLDTMPEGPYRILNVAMFVNTVARTTQAMIAIRDNDVGREMPIFTWDSNDAERLIRIVENDGAPGTLRQLFGHQPAMTPSFGFGVEAPQPVSQIAFRGLTSGFGAGTVIVTALLYQGFPDASGALSARGLPVPSW